MEVAVTRVFSGLITVVLLGLYLYAVWTVHSAVRCLNTPGCTKYTQELSDPILTILNLVGGLVSALVIAILAITPPGQLVSGTFGAQKPIAKWFTEIVSILYLVAWVASGVLLLWDWLRFPNTIPAVATTARSWLGLAVGAAYAYLGLTPPTRNSTRSNE